MRAKYEEMVEESTPGMFEGADRMTAYVWDCGLMGMLSEDDMQRWSDGSGRSQYGKRILSWDSQGFVYLDKFKTVDAASMEMARIRKDEAFEIVQSASDPADLWEELTDESRSPYWLMDCNCTEDEILAEIVRCYGEVLPDQYDDVKFRHSSFPGVALRMTHPSFVQHARVIMVGDDKVHVVSTDDLEVLEAGSYCLDCGQIGCTWHTDV